MVVLILIGGSGILILTFSRSFCGPVSAVVILLFGMVGPLARRTRSGPRLGLEVSALGNGIRSSFYAIVLYDEDPLHRHLIEYIRSCPLWLDYYVLICHDKDVVEPLRYSKSETELDVWEPTFHVKKRHYHVLLKLKSRTHLSAFLKMFVVKGEPVVQYALAVLNPWAYVTYMLHADFESLHDDKKYQYKMSDLVYSLRAEKLLDSQNGNFVQYFTDILDKLSDGMDIWEIAKEATEVLSPASAQEYIAIIRQFQYLFVNRGGKLSLHK